MALCYAHLFHGINSSKLSECGLTDEDWEDIKACLVVAGTETDTPITAL